MQSITLGSTLVYRAPIIADNSLTHRQRESLTVRQMVQSIFGSSAVISHKPSGAPFIVGIHDCISISHCATDAVVAVNNDRYAGVDIELIRPTLARVASRFLSPREMPVYASSPYMLLKAWTLKEAIYKAAGTSPLPLHHIVLPTESDRHTASTPDALFAIYSLLEDDMCISVAEKL